MQRIKADKRMGLALAATTVALLACGGTGSVAPADPTAARALPTVVPSWTPAARATPTATVIILATAAPVRAATMALDATAVATPACKCSGDVYNCDDFGMAVGAQDCYEWCMKQTGRDVHGLDGDGDGLACEFTGW